MPYGAAKAVLTKQQGVAPVYTSPFVATVANEAYQDTGGNVALDGETIAFNPNTAWQAFRFTDVPIPQGATVSSATIVFTSTASQSAALTITIYCEDVADSTALSSGTNDISSRARTTASVTWSPAAWSIAEAGADTTTSSFAAAVQEVLAIAEWVPGNALTVLMTRTADTGGRTAATIENPTYDAAQITIAWS